MKVFIIWILLSLPILTTAQQIDSVTYNKAIRFLESEKYGSALMLVNPLITANDKCAAYYELRGDIYVKTGDADGALADYNTAILFAPHDRLCYLRRANLYYQLQMPDESLQDCDSAIRYAEDDSLKYNAICYRATVRMQKRDAQGAYMDLMQVLAFDSTNVDALAGLGGVLDDLHRGQDAIMYLDKAIKLYPEHIGLRINRGMRYIDAEDCTNALIMFNKALEISPDDPLAFNNRGYVLYKMNDLTNALKDIERSLELGPTNSYAYRNRALVYIAMKEKDKACEDLKTSIKQGFTAQYGDEVEKLIYANCK